MGESRSIRVRISGRVQGVSFRVWTERQANQLGLSGWVRNCEDGSVEAVFSGPDGAVDAMLAACRRGPRPAHVDSVEIVGPAAPHTGPFAVRD
jgi:acylphosphatase